MFMLKKNILSLLMATTLSITSTMTLADNATVPATASSTVQSFTAAAVEFNPQFMQFQANLQGIAVAVTKAAQSGAKLIVLPEMATSGYIYANRGQINPNLDTIPDKTTALLAPIAQQY